MRGSAVRASLILMSMLSVHAAAAQGAQAGPPADASLFAADSGPAASGVTPFSFIHVSDTHISPSAPGHEANLRAAIAEWNAMSARPLFGIHTGDITEWGNEDEFDRYREIRLTSSVPFTHTPGNHETRWTDRSINRFTEHLGSPNVSFVMRGVRFIGFNAAIWVEHHGAVSGDTRRWIVSQLALDPPGTPTVLFTHQPPMYPDSIYVTGDVELWEAIRPYNVRLFLNGHGHIFKSWTVDGVFCHMTKGMMNDAGGYSLYEVDATAIRVYDKRVGRSKNLVATLPLESPRVVVALDPPEVADGTVSSVVTVLAGPVSINRVDAQVDHHDHPADANWTTVPSAGEGRYPVSLPTTGLRPGRHTLSVRAVDAAGGIWLRTAPFTLSGGPEARVFNADTALQGPAAADAERVYVGGWDGRLYAIDRETLSVDWSFATGGAVIGRPDLDEQTVYAGSTDQAVYALDRTDGSVRWTFPTGGPIQGHARVADGAVFIASGDRNLYAIDTGTGEQRWAFPLGNFAQARPAYADGIVYVGAWDNGFHAIDARTGALKWKTTVGSIINYAPAVTSPCVADGRVVLTAAAPSGSPNVRCLDARTGKTLWTQTIAGGASPYGSPTSDGRRVFCAALDGSIWAISIVDGTVLWTEKMPEAAYDCSPVVVENTVVCNTLLGGVQARNAANGARLWDYKAGGGLTFAWPTVAGNAVYLPSMDGTLSEIRISGP